ncbi:Secreted RxLR effector peptide protein [Phytophthora cinnamomi]|uniref:Secreted RxLR effector peptide protein n=1 Tax=Phytophthora cinnamomi TaxID=4785 RepID=UPI0035593D74|nr:Secreted RxLR effector peptide protein [Phytophthora cinnamomi]
MVSKALSGYDLEAEVKVPDLKPFEAETQKKIVSVQHSLFVTCYKMESAKYNLSLQAVDVLAAYIVLHYSMMKGSALMHRPSGAWNQLKRVAEHPFCLRGLRISLSVLITMCNGMTKSGAQSSRKADWCSQHLDQRPEQVPSEQDLTFEGQACTDEKPMCGEKSAKKKPSAKKNSH